MTMATQEQRGAALGAQTPVPSVDLARLVQLLAHAIPKDDNGAGQATWPLLSWSDDRKRLRINTGGVLSRLLNNRDFLESFASKQGSGFMRDFSLPGRYHRMILGGRIFDIGSGKLTTAIKALTKELDAQLDGVEGGEAALAALFARNARETVEAIAKRIDVKLAAPASEVVLMSLQFDHTSPKGTSSLEEAARIISVIEEVEANSWLSSLLAGLRSLMMLRNYEETTIVRAEESLREQSRHQESEINRFLNFLEDEALARVRLATCVDMMVALAQHADQDGAATWKSPLSDYVFRIAALRNAFAFPEAEGLILDLEKHFGTGFVINLGHRMRGAGFYGCFAVWPQWTAQLFETRRQEESTGSIRAIREVSYRFRVNGIDPTSGKTSHLTRLDRLKGILVEAKPGEHGPHEVTKAAAELLAISAVLDAKRSEQPPEQAVEAARAVAADFAANGQKAMAQKISELEANAGEMEAVAEALIGVLRERRQDVLSRAHRAIATRYVSVMDSIIDFDRTATSSAQSRGLLARPKEGAAENAEWFKHIETSEVPVPGSVFSVKVSMRLLQRIAYANKDLTTRQPIVRQSAGPLLQVALQEFTVEEQGSPQWLPVTTDRDTGWKSERGIDMEVRLRAIELRKMDESARHYHAAAASALGVLIHAVLYSIIRRLRSRELLPSNGRILLLRLQGAPKGERTTDGTEMMYALSQAFESALARELPTKMQGIVTTENRTERFRKRGALHAALACFPIVIGAPSAGVPRVGLLTYATRPCASGPVDGEAESYLFTLKSYLGEAVSEPSVGLRVDRYRTQFHIVDSKVGFENPTLILEELAAMKAEGCSHVILLSHHYGSRHINRLADRHTAHYGAQFLDRVAASFDDLTVYPLRRDVYPATRLLRRPSDVSAFEVGRVKEHEQLFDDALRDLLKGLIPVYTFATLAVVGDELKRPQSGFCTYFLDTDLRIGRTEWMEKARTHLIDPHQNSNVRPALIAMLRALHFLEAERPPAGNVALPVLDPFEWAFPESVGGVGEVDIIKSSRRQGPVAISFTALLSHMVDVYHRDRS